MNNKIIATNLVIIFITLLIAFFHLFVLNRYSTSGEKLVSLSSETEELEKENARLTQKIASVSALSAISVRAKEIGLTSSSQIVSLQSPLPIAFSSRSSL